MAVNITEIESVYDSLIGKATATLNTEFDSYGLTAEEKSKVISGVVNNVINVSVQSVQNQEVNEANIALVNAQKLKTDAEELLVDQQVVNLVSEELLIDARTAKVTAEKTLLDTDEQIKTYYYTNIQPEELAKAQEEVDLLQTEDQIKQYNLTSIFPQELENLRKNERKIKSEITNINLNSSAIQSKILNDKSQSIIDYQVKIENKNLIKKQQDLTTKQTIGFENNMEKEKAKMSIEAVSLLAQAGADSGYTSLITNYDNGITNMTDWST